MSSSRQDRIDATAREVLGHLVASDFVAKQIFYLEPTELAWDCVTPQDAAQQAYDFAEALEKERQKRVNER